MADRTYGEIRWHEPTSWYQRGCWLVDCEPHVVEKLKRWFKQIKTSAEGTLVISATHEASRELLWICDLFPMVISADDLARMRALRAEYDETQAIVARILSGERLSADSWLAPAVKPYDFQLEGADMAMALGRLLIMDETGLGKAQPLDAQILTPSGFRAMGDINVGDEVIAAADGQPCRVAGVYPQGQLDCYQVTFSDGSVVECSSEHLWRVRDRHGEWSTQTLAQLLDRGLYTISGAPRWHIPMAAPADLDAGGSRPLDPYLLGALLGESGPDPVDADVVKATTAFRSTDIVLKDALEALDLWDHTRLQKFVPAAYKLAPVATRLALLQGLMDTAGTAMRVPSGNTLAFFYSSSLRLAEDVQWLVESLGGTGLLTPKHPSCPDRYTVSVKLAGPHNPFRLAHKADRWGGGSHETFRPTRVIAKVERIGRKAMQCIAIDHPDHLYVTDRFVTTHNTFTSYLTLRDPDNLPALVVCDAHMQRQWLRQLGLFFPMLRGHIVRTRTVYDPSTTRDLRGYHPDVLICTYSKIDAWAHHLCGGVQTIILDEMQALRTGEGTDKYNGCAMIAAEAKLVIGATASPVYNYGGEAFNLMQIIERDCLGTRQEFTRAWGSDMSNGRIAVREPRALGSHLRDQRLVIRRTRKDVKKELPDVIRIPHQIEADERIFDEELAACGAFDVAELILSNQGDVWERRKAKGDIDWQMRRATGLAKAPYVGGFVALLLESERKIVLAGWHRDCYTIWLEQLAAFNPLMYTGSESAAAKDRNARRFIDDDEARVLIMSLESGRGIDGLQEACRVVVFGELAWSPPTHKQVIDRLNRDGMDTSEPVLAYFPICDYGTDPMMQELHGIKRGQGEPLIDPEAALFSQVAPDAPDRVRKMAEAALARRRARRVMA